MIDAAEYRKIISELMDELPEAFFRDLTGGVIISDAAPVPDYARDAAAFLAQSQAGTGIFISWAITAFPPASGRSLCTGAPFAGRIPARTRRRHGGSCGGSFATSSVTTWNPSGASGALIPWRRRTNGKNRLTWRSAAIGRNPLSPIMTCDGRGGRITGTAGCPGRCRLRNSSRLFVLLDMPPLICYNRIKIGTCLMNSKLFF